MYESLFHVAAKRLIFGWSILLESCNSHALPSTVLPALFNFRSSPIGCGEWPLVANNSKGLTDQGFFVDFPMFRCTLVSNIKAMIQTQACISKSCSGFKRKQCMLKWYIYLHSSSQTLVLSKLQCYRVVDSDIIRFGRNVMTQKMPRMRTHYWLQHRFMMADDSACERIFALTFFCDATTTRTVR